MTDSAAAYIGEVQRQALASAGLTPATLRQVYETELALRQVVAGRANPGMILDFGRGSRLGGTGLDDSPMYDELVGIASTVEDAIRFLNNGDQLPDLPTRVATLPSLEVNARTVRLPRSGQYVIFVGWQFLALSSRFCYSLAEIVVDFNAGRVDPTDLSGLMQTRAAASFIDSLVGYGTTGRPSAGLPHLPSPEACELAEMLLAAVETFAIAHEYAHIVERHLAGSEAPVEIPELDSRPKFSLESTRTSLHCSSCSQHWRCLGICFLRSAMPGLISISRSWTAPGNCDDSAVPRFRSRPRTRTRPKGASYCAIASVPWHTYRRINVSTRLGSPPIGRRRVMPWLTTPHS